MFTSYAFSHPTPQTRAQSPAEKRDSCRLLVLGKIDGMTKHMIFKDVIDFLDEKDILVVNSSKVIPARLLGVTDKTGSEIELLLFDM